MRRSPFSGIVRRLPTRCTVIVLLFLSYKSAWSETDHLIPAHPVPEDYYAALTYLLNVTPFDSGRCLVTPAFDPEYCVSIYSDTCGADNARFWVTGTIAATNVWYASHDDHLPLYKIGVTRHDRVLPNDLALSIRQLWFEFLSHTKAAAELYEGAPDKQIVQFSLSRGPKVFTGELPDDPSARVHSLKRIGDLLLKYSQSDKERGNAIIEQLRRELKSIGEGDNKKEQTGRKGQKRVK